MVIEVLPEIGNKSLQALGLPPQAGEAMAHQLGRAFKVAISESAQASGREIKVEVRCLSGQLPY